MPEHDIIVIGASAGGVEALIMLTGTLPSNWTAAVFIVLHVPAQSPSLLPDILNRSGRLNVVNATDNADIEYGHIYVAPPDFHLLVEREHMRVVSGPRENRHRPAIDPLFRSAAAAYGPRVTGVILTGSLDDGTAGLQEIKRCGGLAIVQDPQNALFPSMPLSALANVQVDFTLPLAEIGPLLGRLSYESSGEESTITVDEEMKKELRLEQMNPALMHTNERRGKPSVYSCPDCGGVLWEIEDDSILRFRCRVGHAFSIESMFAGQSESVENALWVALKNLQENADFTRRLVQHARTHGHSMLAQRYETRLREVNKHIEVIANILKNSNQHESSVVEMDV
ncbi:MAG TPA: chemotaxis protein CheB [Ktedonobacteraceae bacterium]|nr:chemotaxis protein CheB [Ktedonobacteraceae bacterium]